jgi:hypothetical protein
MPAGLNTNISKVASTDTISVQLLEIKYATQVSA